MPGGAFLREVKRERPAWDAPYVSVKGKRRLIR